MLSYFFSSVKTKKVSTRSLLREKAASDSQLLLGRVYRVSSPSLNLAEPGFESGPVGPGTVALSGSGYLFFQILILLPITGLTASSYVLAIY